MISVDCSKPIEDFGLSKCCNNNFSRNSEVYFNPETKEVFADKELKILLGHGELNGDVLIITKTAE